ncbi:glycosyl transferase family 9 [Saccharopolyspora sp. K220]|uniref:glycosyl transferase family 9 n=1 Tax=Saccharopolyspora soli TaxID=2926618 RepID=UPI001F5A60B3|nr:glycosyl transferase family 9 [Saccharopolyspora soli]MCI2418282.1 glycosyl transferase family 9 [Saccharopolyspora soli]
MSVPVQQDLIQWHVADVRCHPGGRMLVPIEQAPFGRVLPYRRSAGEGPPPGCAPLVRDRGWIADLGQRGLSELLLGLSSVTALLETTPSAPLHYSGPEAQLMQRCSLPVESSTQTWGPHVIRTPTRSPVRFRIDPGEPPAWLDRVEDQLVDVHASLPMRHYLALEQSLGVRLAVDAAPVPRFPSEQPVEPGHVVLVTVPGWPRHLDFQLTEFAAVATELLARGGVPWRFTVVAARNTALPTAFDGLPVEVWHEPGAANCIDLFASAELVLGTDTGLTQLAALTSRADGSAPQVIGLYSRHAHTKWITGLPHQHAVATRFAQMLALADRNAEPSELTNATWGAAADMRGVPAALVADFAAQQAGW